MSHPSAQKAKTVLTVKDAKERGRKLSMVTCYDAAFGRIIDRLPLDMVLVGDSLGNVILGFENTVPVTIDDMVHHCAAVSRVVKKPMVIADLPFFSGKRGMGEGIDSACRLVQEGGAAAVKLEGGKLVLELVDHLVTAGIPVMGHLGLTPQSIHAMGGHKVQGKGEAAAELLKAEALRLEDAGAFALVLEGIPEPLGQEVSASLNIPTIGIGAGRFCDGQVLVLHDLLGFDSSFQPRFLKRYFNMEEAVTGAISQFITEVENDSFPTAEHGYGVVDP